MTSEEPTTNLPHPVNTTVVHVIFLAMSVTIVLLSFVMKFDGGDMVSLPGFQSPMPETCSSKAYFGLSCPGCGLTRSFISISRGQFGKAWQLNPASFFVYVFVAIQIPWQCFQIWRLRQGKPIIESSWVYLPLMVCTFALAFQWVIKLCMGVYVT